MRRGEAVAGGHRGATVLPGDRHVHAPRAELDRRRGVVVDPPRVRLGVSGHREHRAEQRRIARRRHVVGGADERHRLEIRSIGQVVEDRVQRLALRRQAQVADLDVVLDRPLEPGGEGGSLAAQVGAKDPDADELHVGSQREDDVATRRAMSEHVDRVVGHHPWTVVGHLDRHVLDDASAKPGMCVLQPRVDDAHPDAGPGRPTPGPITRDPLDPEASAKLAPAVGERLGPGRELGRRHRPMRPRWVRSA